jgi:3-isopropylmalate/(R)-2-methylmalate dehydratase small subunit
MKPFTSVSGRVAVLDRTDVDTDQIIPKQFLKRLERTGWGDFLFFDWRLDEEGNPRPEFELNRPEYTGARVLIAGKNFGCGSSREHAPWALQDYGFDVVIAPSFGDIFRTNCGKIGLVAIELPERDVHRLMDSIHPEAGTTLTVDLERQQIVEPSGRGTAFEFDPALKHRLLNGLDDIGLALVHEGEIAAFESRHAPGIDTRTLTGS